MAMKMEGLRMGYESGQLCKNRITPPPRIDAVKDMGTAHLIVSDNRKGQFLVNRKTLLESLGIIVITTDQEGTAAGARIPFCVSVKRRAVGRTAFQTGNTLKNPATDHLVGKIQQNHQIQWGFEGIQCLVEMLGLGNGSGKPIEEKARAMFLHPASNDADRKFIGDKKSFAGPFIGLLAQGSSPITFGAQKRTGGDVGNTECL
jgi:hypothetical protein